MQLHRSQSCALMPKVTVSEWSRRVMGDISKTSKSAFWPLKATWSSTERPQLPSLGRWLQVSSVREDDAWWWNWEKLQWVLSALIATRCYALGRPLRCSAVTTRAAASVPRPQASLCWCLGGAIFAGISGPCWGCPHLLPGCGQGFLEPGLTVLVSPSSPCRLGNCDLTAGCCATLATAMATKQCLTELDLSYNPLEDEGIRKICEALKKPSCNVQQLMWGMVVALAGVGGWHWWETKGVLGCKANFWLLLNLDVALPGIWPSNTGQLCIFLFP